MVASPTRARTPALLAAFLALALSGLGGCGSQNDAPARLMDEADLPDAPARAAAPRGIAQGDILWPPRIGQPYPDLRLQTPEGDWVQLSDYQGKVLVIEPIGMSCPACNAWAGGNSGAGGFRGVRPQRGLESLKSYTRDIAGVRLDDSRLMYIHLVIYDSHLQCPSAEDLAAWRDHFRVHSPNALVLGGTPDMINPSSYKLIPGVQLVDRDFVLRSDSSGHHPTDNLYDRLLPMLGQWLRD